MKKLITTLAISLLLIPAVRGQQHELTLLGDKLVVSGEITLSDTDTLSFVNALLWGASKAEKDKDNLITCDWKNFKTEILVWMESSKRRAYSAVLSARIDDGLMVYMLQNIKEYPVAGVKVGVGLERFYPAEKPAQAEVLSEATGLIDALLEEFETFVKENEPDIDWGLNNAISQKVMRGMTVDEIILAKGKPMEITDNGKKATWQYSDGSCLIIENGHLKATL